MASEHIEMSVVHHEYSRKHYHMSIISAAQLEVLVLENVILSNDKTMQNYNSFDFSDSN